MRLFFVIIFLTFTQSIYANIELGVDVFFNENHFQDLKDKNVGLITNHTGVDSSLKSSIQKFKENAKEYHLIALFSPEHGVDGQSHASDRVDNSRDEDGIIIYSLHGKTKRPNDEMLKDIDVLVFDIQEIGNRCYTYLSTLFYCMEEAAKKDIQFIVLDRPNPINGITVDGPMLEESYRSFIGYINIPYCHGMTIGELALFFNEEYRVKCKLKVIPMKGWKREMSFEDTNLTWIPTSPHIPEADTPFYCLSTGIMGELHLVNIGIGYTLPFKVIGAPWISAEQFSDKLNEQNLVGVKFIPFHFRPFYGLYKGEDCHGVKIVITDKLKYKPLSVQYLMLGILKSLYPQQVASKIERSEGAKALFCQANGTKEILNLLKNEKYPAWKMIEYDKQKREKFLQTREKYLIKKYN